MTTPTYEELLRPVLELLRDGQVRRTREVCDAMAEQYGLTAEQRAEKIPSGRARRFDNRVNWALTYMFQSGLTTRPRRGEVVITDVGLDLLTRHSGPIDVGVLEQFPGYIDFKNRFGTTRVRRTESSPDATGPVVSGGDLEPEVTPLELLDEAVALNRSAVESEVLARALAITPTEFEELVVQLLQAMGYGQAGSAERTSASGDAGIDGIISQDPLGLDRIYVQAKRYAVDQAVDRPRI